MNRSAIKALVIGAGIGVLVIAGTIAAAKTGLLDRIPGPATGALTAANAETPGPGTIPPGTWTVGTDIQPGTYTVTKALPDGSDCYWVIYKTGTNQRSIVANQLLDAGGLPSVTLVAGQDFSSHDCGTWIKQR